MCHWFKKFTSHLIKLCGSFVDSVINHGFWDSNYFYHFFIRPCVAGAVLQIPSSLIESFIQSFFSYKLSKHYYTQTVIARERKFWEDVHPPTICHMSCVRWQVSGYRCQVSHVACHVSHDTCLMSHFNHLIPPPFFLDEVV